MNKDHIFTPGDIVLYNGAPAKVINYSTSGVSVALKLAKNHYKTVLKADVEPYKGDGDAVSLGLGDED